MISQRATINNRPVQAIIDFLQGYSEVVQEEARRAYDEVAPLALSELRIQPGPVVYPIEWSSDKQRKAFFASDGFGQGIPTRRTGHLENAWEFFLDGSGTQFSAVIRNRNPASPFVYGSLSKTNPGKFKQRFHTNTGWETMYGTAQFWLNALQEQFVANMVQRLGDLVGDTRVVTRGYTGRTR